MQPLNQRQRFHIAMLDFLPLRGNFNGTDSPATCVFMLSTYPLVYEAGSFVRSSDEPENYADGFKAA